MQGFFGGWKGSTVGCEEFAQPCEYTKTIGVAMFERYIVSYMNYINKAVIKKKKISIICNKQNENQMQDY